MRSVDSIIYNDTLHTVGRERIGPYFVLEYNTFRAIFFDIPGFKFQYYAHTT